MGLHRIFGALGILMSCSVGATAQTQTPPAPAPAATPSQPSTVDQDVQKRRREQMRGPDSRIINGIPAAPGRWPFAVAFAEPSDGGKLTQYCGGSVISDRWILTAAHCLVAKTDKVILGRSNLTGGDGEVIGIVEVIQHPSYNKDAHDSDVALVRLERATRQKPVALARDGFSPPKTATAIGWGLMQEKGTPSDRLLQIDIPVIDNNTCASLYKASGTAITANMVCAGAIGMDTCQGDSGGPLSVVNPDTGADVVVGVVSFGIGCARPGYLGVYSRVSRFAKWIETKTGVKPGAKTASK